jgi:hypothetical protein
VTELDLKRAGISTIMLVGPGFDGSHVVGVMERQAPGRARHARHAEQRPRAA